MANTIKSLELILSKLNIAQLNPMQEEAKLTIHSNPHTVLLSPTGTGKTLAFLLPLIDELDANSTEIQALIVVPSRELALQIEQVIRGMGTGYKANAVYGGRAGSKDKIDLQHRPAILVGTPGRIADHLRKESFSSDSIKTLVLDEFDKSLEIGFKTEMKELVSLLPKVQKKILTSATQEAEIPEFVGLKNPVYIDYLHEEIKLLQLKTIVSPTRDKLETLVQTLNSIGNQPGIIFCNLKDSIQFVSDFLNKKNIQHGLFHGDMEQIDRERTLIKFRNGTHQLLLATDIAARGIDVPELKFIIHYQLPPNAKEFTHRNGRTARMNAEGTAYILQWRKEELPEFITNSATIELKNAPTPAAPIWETLYITGGRRDKVSKGDIVGLFMKQGQLQKDELGIIELKQECAYVGVKSASVDKLLPLVNNQRLKKKKVRVSRI